jgi:hypothetical protein
MPILAAGVVLETMAWRNGKNIQNVKKITGLI